MKSISRNVQHLRRWMNEESAIPPVSPEVINILLFPRSDLGMDAPSEYIIVIYVSCAHGCLKIRDDTMI